MSSIVVVASVLRVNEIVSVMSWTCRLEQRACVPLRHDGQLL